MIWEFLNGLVTGRYGLSFRDLQMCPTCHHKKEPQHIRRGTVFYCLECGKLCKGWE